MLVEIQECRPLSKTKSWVVTKLLNARCDLALAFVLKSGYNAAFSRARLNLVSERFSPTGSKTDRHRGPSWSDR
jgi:hypothetical protein